MDTRAEYNLTPPARAHMHRGNTVMPGLRVRSDTCMRVIFIFSISILSCSCDYTNVYIQSMSNPAVCWSAYSNGCASYCGFILAACSSASTFTYSSGVGYFQATSGLANGQYSNNWGGGGFVTLNQAGGCTSGAITFWAGGAGGAGNSGNYIWTSGGPAVNAFSSTACVDIFNNGAVAAGNVLSLQTCNGLSTQKWFACPSSAPCGVSPPPPPPPPSPNPPLPLPPPTPPPPRPPPPSPPLPPPVPPTPPPPTPPPPRPPPSPSPPPPTQLLVGNANPALVPNVIYTTRNVSTYFNASNANTFGGLGLPLANVCRKAL